MNFRRFWFEFEGDHKNLPPGLGYGCGVTAVDLEDALKILKERIFGKYKITYLEPSKFIENIDVLTLDKGHVLPNMYSPEHRGVWFLIGYEEQFRLFHQ